MQGEAKPKPSRVYYEDGRFIEGLPPHDRRWGVICIVQGNEQHGRQVVSGGDYYYCRKGRWFTCDLIGLLDQLTENWDQIEAVLIGRMTDRETYNRILSQARLALGLPEMTAMYAEDARPR